MAETQQQKRSQYHLQQIKNLQRRINSPKTDLLETETQFIVRMELSVKSYSWELKDEQFLFVSFEKEKENFGEVNEIYRETKYGKTMRRVKLPNKVLTPLASETYENGVWIAHFNKQVKNEPTVTELLPQLSLNTILEEGSKSWAEL
jgi:HSP20 family molecular chaperone IbpA